MDSVVALTAGGGVGGFGYMFFQRVFANAQQLINPTNPNMWSAITGFVVMLLMNIYIKKTHAKWAQQFGMTIAMFTGMIVGSFFL